MKIILVTIGMLLLAVTTACAQQTNLAVTVRHAPSLNGGVIQGSLQQLDGENVTVNGGFAMTGNLLVPGTPTLRVNGHPSFAGTLVGHGSALPTGYQVTLNGDCSLNYLYTHTDPLPLPTVSPPPPPTGTRSVSINKAGQSYGDPATLRDLTLNGNVGMISVPPGTYGNFTVNGGSGLVIGVTGGGQAVNYNLQNLTLNGNSSLKVVGPVVLTVANGFTANGTVGASNNPVWLQLRVASGGFTLNSGCNVYGSVTAPSGTATINGNSTLVGALASDRFILNGGGLVRWSSSPPQTNRPPVATNQTITLAENSSTNITLTGADPQGLALTFSILTQPAHGTLSGSPPNVTYQPTTNYFGSDAFTFKVNNGITDSAPATVSLVVTQVYYPPVAHSQTLTNFENTLLLVTLTGSDPQGYALTYSVLTQPAHGSLSGTAPNLTYLPATNYFGNDSFTFRVNDGVSNSAPATISITNQPVDQPPLVVAGPNQLIILPTNTVSLAGSVTYANFPGTVDTVVWSQVSGPGSVTFSNPSNVMTLATFSTNGIYRLRLYASDYFLSGSNDLFVTVDAPPVVNAGPGMTNTFPGTITLSGTAGDDGLPTNGTLTVLWSQVSGPGTVVFGNASVTNSSAVFSTNGIYVLRLTADDGVATNHSDITIIENLPPVANAGTDILTNGLQAVLNGSVSDDGLPGSSLSAQWSQSGGPGTVVFGSSQKTNTTVVASQSGTYVLTLTAFDGAATNSSEVVVTFNLPPDVNAGPTQTVNFSGTVTLAGTATDDRLPRDILNTTWTQISGPGAATFADATLTNTTVTFDQPGVYTLRLSATDTLATNSADVVIRVNAAPAVNAGPDQTVPFGAQAVLAGSYTDDGIPGPTVTTLWTQISGPADAVFTDPAITNPTVSFSQSGDYVFQLTANDGMTNSSAKVTITVLPAPPVNHPPVAQSQTVSTVTNTPVNITLTATDADNDPLTFQVLTGPANGTLTGNAPNLIYQPSAGFIGTDSFNFVANDGKTNSAPATVTIDVQAPTNSLQLIVPEAQEALQDAPFTFNEGKRITIEGGTTGGGSLLLSLSVTNGTLTLGSTNGLTVVSGANGTTNLVVSGSQDDLNTALDGLIYLGNPFFVGTDTIVAMVERTDGSGASDSKIVPVTVLPILTFVGPLTGATEQVPFIITYDNLYWNSDIGDGVSFRVESLTAGDLNKDGNQLEYGTSTISPGDSVIWIPPAGAIGVVDAFHVRAWDGTHLSSNDVPVYVNVKALTKPHLNVPGDQISPCNMPLVFDLRRPISITDDLSLGTLELSLTVSNGALTLNPVDGLEWLVGTNGLSHQVIRGTLANLNTALSGLSYLNAFNFSGIDLLQIKMEDLGNNSLGMDFSDTKTVAITVIALPNNPPQVSIINPPGASQVQTGQIITVEVAATDLDGEVTNVTLLADGGELARFTGPPFTTTWIGAALGKHVLSATATDNRGAVSVSVPVSVWVVDENGDFTVDAGPDQVISLPDSAILAGTIDIPTPVAGNQPNVTWLPVEGPSDVQFSTPNALNTVAQFSQSGTYTIRLQVEYAGQTRSDLLQVDVLPVPPNRLTAARSNQGSDFWLTFLDNFQPYGELNHYGKVLLVTGDKDADVWIRNPNDYYGDQSQRFHIQAGLVTVISPILSDDSLRASDSIQENAIHVTADQPVTIYGLNYEDASTDGYLALPTAMLGTDYIVLAYRNSFYWDDTNSVVGGTQFAVVASENNTTITITPSATVGSRIAGVPYQIILQQGQTYRLINYDDPNADLSGTLITADKPVAVFGGVTIALVPPRTAAGDHLVEQLPPVNLWGNHFITMPLATRTKGDTFRFLAATNGTRVAVNGKIVASLDRGQFYEQIIDVPAEILANKPILVAQYANGSDYDGNTGDPFMMLVPPCEQFGGAYTLSTSTIKNGSSDLFTNYLNLVVRSNGVGTILLDDVLVPTEHFQPVGNSGYAGAQLPLNSGTHHLSGPVPFGACVYGWAWYESYAFSGGIYSDSVEPDTRLELTQTTPFAAVGHEKTVEAHVTNGRDLSLPDLNVSFSVSGANSAEGQVTVSHLGEAVFSYTGTNAGVDVITATIADLEQSVTNTWIAGSDNAPPVVSTADTPPLQFSWTAQLVGSVTDDNRPAGCDLHVQWRLLGGPAKVQFENATQAVTRVFCPQSGRYVFELSADDSQFSSRALVIVVVDDIPVIFGHDIPSLVPVGSPLELGADAWDDDGTIGRVEFYANDVLIGTVTNEYSWQHGYGVNWTPLTNGRFQIRAVAFDDLGGSNTVSLGGIQVSYSPQVLIDSPPSGAVLTVPTNVLIHAVANDPDGTIASLGIYANGQLLAMTNGPDLTVTWFPQYQGNFDLTAVVEDNLGLTITSAAIPVTVTGDFPHVTIINNCTNQWGSEYIRIPLGLPALLQADAWMPGPHQITNVDFYVVSPYGESKLIGSFSGPPYQVAWTPQNGSYQLFHVVAEADSGAIGEDTSLFQYYRDVSVAFASPTAGQTVAVGKPTAIQLSVRDPGHVIGTFDYYVNGQLLVETNSDMVLWTPSAPGNYELSVHVIDQMYGTWFETESLSVNANFAFLINGVWIVSPEDGDSLYVGSPTFICLTFEDPTGDFDHAEVFTNGVSLGQTTNSCFEWVPEQTNDYSLTAVVYDHQGNASTPSDPVLVHVSLPPPPEIVITSPKDGDRLAVNQETLVVVDVNDPAQAVTNLELFVDGTKVTDSLDSSIPWTPDSIGNHTLTVIAADWNSNQVASAPVNVTVVEMHPPTVTVTSPADGLHYIVETLPPLRAEAADADGVVTNLVLELDGAVLGKTNGTTLELSATNILGGWHTVLARATDNDGLTTASTAVSFFIERSEDANLPIPQQLTADALSATEIRLHWEPLPTNSSAASVFIERWDDTQSAWIEIGKVAVTETNYTDSHLNPETCYRYRAATTDNIIRRSAYSAEVRATTRTVVPNYSVIDLTEALIASLTGPSDNVFTNSGLHCFDSRRTVPLDASHADSVLGTNATALKLAVARFKERWPQIQLDYDPVLLSPKSIMPRLGYLTGPGGAGVTVSDATAQMFDPADPNRPAKAFLQEYQTLFGFGPEALDAAKVRQDYVSAGNGARTVVWQQQVAGVPVFNALLIGHITQAGELACLSSEFIPSPAQAADPALLAAVQSGAALPLSAPQALAAAVTNAGDRFAGAVVTAETDANGVTRRQTFTASSGVKGEVQTELTWFPASRAQLKLCWQVLFTSQWRDEMYLTLVTADTGEILYRRNLTADSLDTSYRIYTDSSPAPMLPGLPVPGTDQPALVDRGLVTLPALDISASPNGWIDEGTNETWGNNVDAHLDRDDDSNADLPRPMGNPWRVFDYPLNLTGNPDSYGDAAVVELFFWNNWMHDALYELGFTESAGNFQNNNFGRGGLGGDAIQADAQDGLFLNDSRHHNNANMSTPPDGYAPRMQMYVFDGATPARDGSLDAEIILHEYTHGLSTRLIGGGAGIDALQTAGMSEGWSDFYALSLLTNPTNDVDATYPLGSYLAYHAFGSTFEENYYYGIRHYPYCTDTNKNPLTFADIDPAKASSHTGVPRNPLLGSFRADQAGEVHSQGEVWGMMLWEMRANLIRKLGPEAGNNLALQLVTDGLKLSPPDPNFVQARDAILLADRMLSGGTNSAEIWSAFAKRGLGFSAKAPESYTTSGAQESRDLMPALAAEQVEIQTASGAVEPGLNNNLLIHLRNQGDAAATQVSGQLATATADVSVLQNLSTYADIPPGESRANNAVFQIQTGNGFIEGTPIDLAFTITSAQSAGNNYLRLFTGVPGAEILFDNYSALADPSTNSSGPRDLTPVDLDRAEPLWMAEDISCLLKLDTGEYMLWRPTSNSIVLPLPPGNSHFIAHRLTRNGVVVGRIETNATVDFFGDKLPHTWGVKWDPNGSQDYEPLTLTGNEYRYPKTCSLYTNVGSAYDLTISPPTNWVGFVTNYPTLQDVWDINSSTQAVGAATVYVRPTDANDDGVISRMELEFSLAEMHAFAADGTLDRLTVTERGANAGYTSAATMQVDYNAMLASAAEFYSPENWRWLGPLTNGFGASLYSTALLVDDTGTIAGYGAVQTDNPPVNAPQPTHAFRVSGDLEFDKTTPILQDLGALPGGLYSFPRAMNQLGQLVGYSQYQLSDSTAGFHGVFWDVADVLPQDLRSLQQVNLGDPLSGFSDAYAINDNGQIVGTSHRASDGASAAVLWRLNHDTNGTPFWEITDLNNRLTDDSWYVLNAVGINHNGLILAHALLNAAGEKHAVLLIPAAMTTDVNRDGQINFDGSDMTSQSNPFRFWINDSQESGDISDADHEIPESSSPNWAKSRVNGRSDLVNFFPVALNLTNALQLFPPSHGWQYRLSQAGSAVKFVYTTLTPDSVFDYLTNSAATSGYGADSKEAPETADTIAVSPSGIVLDTSWLTQVQNHGGVGIILVEGSATTTEPLMLEICRNSQKLAGISLYLSLDGVEKMFRHKNLMAVSGGSGGQADRLTDSDVPNEPTTDGKNFVFLPGYNENPEQSRGWESEMFKRLYWSGSKAKFWGVTWNGADSQVHKILWINVDVTINYHINVVHAFQTAPALASFLNEIQGDTEVAAHSLGNMVVLSTMNDYKAQPHKYFMIDAAIPIEALDASVGINNSMVHPDWTAYEDRLWASEWWQLFTNTDARSTLTWSNRLGSISSTEIYNFYSSGEEVLRTWTAGAPPSVTAAAYNQVVVYDLFGHSPVGNYVWCWQELMKGRCAGNWILGSDHGGWKFNLANDSGYARFVNGLRVPIAPEMAATISTEQLQTNAFFDWGNYALSSHPDFLNLPWDGGSDYAQTNRNRILADAIPALSLPVGANHVDRLFPQGQPDRNFDMQAYYENRWPSARGPVQVGNPAAGEWHHSDCAYVAYPFTYQLFDKIVTLGNLR